MNSMSAPEQTAAGSDDTGTDAAGTARGVMRNAVLLAAASIGARLTLFALGVVIARVLGVEEYGRYGVALALAAILVPVADFGATPYIARETARDLAHADAVTRGLLDAKLAAGVAIVVLVGAAGWLLGSDFELLAVIVVMLLAALVEGFARFVYAYYQGRERMGFEAYTTFGAALGRAVGGVVILVAVGELLPVLVWLLVTSVAQYVVADRRLRRATRGGPYVGPFAGRRRPVPWRPVVSMGLISIFVMVYLRADTVLVAWLLDERFAGYYTAAYSLLASLQIAPAMLAVALTPVFSRTYDRQPELFAATWHEGLKAVLLVSLPLALVTSILSAPIIGRIFGDEFGPSAGILTVLVWACPLAGLNVVASAAMRGAGREGWLAAVSAAGAVLNVGVNLYAIPAYGVGAAAAVTVATETAVFLGLCGAAVARGIVPWPSMPYVRIAIALAALAAVAIAGASLPVELAIVAALLGYATVLLATGVVRGRDVVWMWAAVLRRA
jgi:O-antigen/teichoic acid export membrane protein